MNANDSVKFFDTQFQQQARDRDFRLNPFELAALPHLHGRVLDYGCGLGNLAFAAAERGCSVLALDASPAAITHIKQRAAVASAAAGARAESERLREQLAALPAADSASGPGADGSPIAELLGACADRYQAVAAEADRLAGQVRGLQKYAVEVCMSDRL